MATIDTLASLNTVPAGNLLVLIVDGLSTGQEYRIYERTSDALTELVECDGSDVIQFVHTQDAPSYWGSTNFTADANGRIVQFFNNFVADTQVLSVHDRVNPAGRATESWKTSDTCGQPPADRREEGVTGYTFGTTSPAVPLDPWYVTVDNLVATPGVGEVDLSWDAGTLLDAGRGSIEYTVLRRNAAGDPNPVTDVLVSGLTTTSYTDMTPVDGVTYKYRIHARLAWDGFDPWTADGYLPYALSFNQDMSNIETVTLGSVAEFTVSLNVRVPMRAPT